MQQTTKRGFALLCSTIAGLIITIFAVAAAAQTRDAALEARLTLADEIRDFPFRIRDTLTSPQWLADDRHFVYWSAVEPHRETFVRVDARTGKQTPLLSPAALRGEVSRLSGREVPFPPYFDLSITPDRQRLVFPLGDDVFALTLAEAKLTRLAPADLDVQALSPQKLLSPDRRFIAVRQPDGFAVTDASGRTVTERRDEEHYAWEIPDRAWSPDGRFLLVWRNDARAVHKLPVIDYSTPLERVTMVPYVKSGTPLAKAELHVIEAATGRSVQVASPEGESYVWLAGWRPDSSEALVLHLSRDGKRLDLRAVSPSSATSRLVIREERPESFVAGLDLWEGGWDLQVTPLPGNRELVWMSERDGWRHVYLYDYDGKLVRQLTSGAFPVHRVAGTTNDALLVLASADAAHPYDHDLYRVPLRGGPLQALTRDGGIHRVALSPSGRYYTDGHSTREQPRVWEVGSSDGRTKFRYAAADASGLAPWRRAIVPEGITVTAADGVTPLHGVLYKPFDFDPAKRYAVIAYVYGGPFKTIVPWSFAGNGDSRDALSLAQMGFIVMVLDARGTPGRSKAFQDAHYGRVGQTEIPDHLAALRQAAATRPWMDLTRAGIYGHSWGGYFVLRGMLTAPEFFKAGYAGAPGAFEEEALVNEPHLGLPAANPAGYAAGDNMPLAANLRGTLRMMHGTSDTSASPTTTMRMADALIRAGKQFELLVMPGQRHNPRGPARKYYKDDVRLFFLRTLGEPR
ncbi:MAG TPA: DPP IV N-terminal domain-containing protein [Thermoanaerobaculia bacterium]|nr:DPP IV N-terminal domain-containing protein [Thermoanaerobaculia bacterium]